MADFIERLRQAIKDATGLDVALTRSRDHATLHYGYARVQVPESFDRPGARTVIQFREEGKGDRGKLSEMFVPFEGEQDMARLVAACSAILRTGRTIECGKGVNLRDLNQWPSSRYAEFGLTEIARMVRDDVGLDLDPDYQRGHVWTDKQASLFVGHLLEGGVCAPLYVLRYESATNGGVHWLDKPMEMIDGKQRYTAIVRWLAGEIPAELADGTPIWFRDTNEVDRRGMPTIRVHFVDLPRAEVLRLYIKLNRGGSVHTDAEIEHVRGLLADAERK